MPPLEHIEAETPLATLVMYVQEGDLHAWEELIVRCAPIVRRIAYRISNDTHLADDIAQEVFLQALRKICDVRDPAAFLGWLKTTTRHFAINMMIRGSRAWSVEDVGIVKHIDYRITQDSPIDAMVRREEVESLHRVVAKLRPIDKDVINAFHFDEQSLVEIADRLDAPMGTIKRRLHIARKRLRKELEETLVR
ncbi:sigma-70 family RNA polymerase sigma factor [Candidatus Peregrinibacteria bacterium]|nr:sigma-70 family RNA polymerase sigma factor [Candidatus Peregrinibacteria bacterium]